MSGLNHYKYIDALRGIAFLGVLTVHAAQRAEVTVGMDVLDKGQYGVQLFFLLSAVTLLRSASLRSKETFPVRNFYIRRLFRIAPLFWFGIAFYFFLHGNHPSYWAPEGLKVWYYISTIFFVHTWWPTSLSVVPGGWSIGVEMMFYLCLPWFARRITSIGSSCIAACCAFALSLIVNGSLQPVLTNALSPSDRFLVPWFLFWWFPSQLPVFLVGFALYYCLNNRTVTTFLAKPGHAAALGGLGGCSLAGLIWINSSQSSPIHVAYSIAFAFIILYQVR